MQQCLTCGGVYSPIQTDGTEYYHVCPPLSAPELAAAVAAGAVTLPDGETVDDALARRTYHRAAARNENVTGPPVDAQHDAPIVSAGSGVQALPDAVAAQTVVTVPPVLATTNLLPRV